ncbi:MAG: pirin-like C-terminal cupin domain-containing protein, partial [Bacteroidota bacterium]
AALLDVAGQLYGEIGVCVVNGYIGACGERIEKGNMMVSKQEDICQIVMGEHTHVLLFGGQPFPEERFIYWNFVASDKAKLEAAKQRWADQTFDMVPGETGYVPLPGR